MATDPKPKKLASDRVFKDDADKARQEKADREGSAHPFQKALKLYESKGTKVFHYNDKTYQHSDKPFKNSRPIAARTTEEEKVVVKKETPKTSGLDKIKPLTPSTEEKKAPHLKIAVKKEQPTKIYEQGEKGKRSHGTVKNTLLRKIEAKINPDKYGAPSAGGTKININRSKTYKSGEKPKVAGYNYPLGNGKSVKTKTLKGKDVMQAAKKAGYIK